MYLTIKKCRGYRYLQLMESVHVKGQRNCIKRLVKNYGRFEDAPEDVRKAYEDKTARKALTKRLESEVRALELQQVQTVIEQQKEKEPIAGEASPFNKGVALNFGHLPLREIWERELNLKYRISYLQKTKTDISTWQLNDLLFYLCATKVFMPMSYYQASERRSNFFYCPWNGVTQDNFYRALDFVYDHRESLISHAVKSRMSHQKTKVKVAFFDCTNTWFETPYDDLTWQIIRFTHKVRAELIHEGKTDDDIEAHLNGEQFTQDLAQHLELSEADILRMRGCSKEGRFAQPIVTVALAVDQTGFPIDCKVFAGNMSELKSIDPMLESLKKKYAVDDVYFVADRGLNSTETLDKIQKEKLGFVVAQKVSMQKKEIREQMLDLNGYRNCYIGSDGQFHQEESSEIRENAFRFKACNFKKTAYIENPQARNTELGRTRRKKTAVDCRIIFTYSPERRARDLADLEDKIAKASKAVGEGRLMGNPCSSGWRALIQTQKEASGSTNEKEQYRAVGLKDDVIADRKAVAGYAAVVYSHPEEKSDNSPKIEKLSELQVLSTYHKLVAIEDSFRTMKSTFSIRPVHVRLKERITAHCYLCVLSLMLLRSLQEKLDRAGTLLSAGRIASALKQALLLPLPTVNGKVQQLLNITLHPSFHTAQNQGKSMFEGKLNDTLDHDGIFSAFIKGRNKVADDLDLILQASGLQPPLFSNSLGELKKRLGVHTYPDSTLFSAEHLLYLDHLGKSQG